MRGNYEAEVNQASAWKSWNADKRKMLTSDRHALSWIPFLLFLFLSFSSLPPATLSADISFFFCLIAFPSCDPLTCSALLFHPLLCQPSVSHQSAQICSRSFFPSLSFSPLLIFFFLHNIHLISLNRFLLFGLHSLLHLFSIGFKRKKPPEGRNFNMFSH